MRHPVKLSNILVIINDIFQENKNLRMSKMFLSIVSKYRQRNDVDQYPRMNDTLFLIGFKKTQENVDKNYFLTCNRF